MAITHLTYPNESAEYRKARNALLAEEMALRKHIEAVAAQRRALPPDGEAPEDYLLERISENGMPEKIEMTKLFGRHQTLILYSFMYDQERHICCCTPVADALPQAVTCPEEYSHDTCTTQRHQSADGSQRRLHL
jgi:predicted dithiol-disulfide oxidoreductase (DUF899 family)